MSRLPVRLGFWLLGLCLFAGACNSVSMDDPTASHTDPAVQRMSQVDPDLLFAAAEHVFQKDYAIHNLEKDKGKIRSGILDYESVAETGMTAILYHQTLLEGGAPNTWRYGVWAQRLVGSPDSPRLDGVYEGLQRKIARQIREEYLVRMMKRER